MTEKDLIIQDLRREVETLKAEIEWEEKVIELAQRQAAQAVQWISVKDRLPNLMQDVLIFFDDRCVEGGNMAVGFLRDTDEHLTFWGAWCDGGWNMQCEESPMFWMPLPKNPERKNGANDGNT